MSDEARGKGRVNRLGNSGGPWVELGTETCHRRISLLADRRQSATGSRGSLSEQKGSAIAQVAERLHRLGNLLLTL